MITCGEAEDLIERRLDGEMAAGSERTLTEHLAGCEACSRLLDREAAVDTALAAHFADAAPTPHLGRRVLLRVHAEDSVERMGWIADALNAAGGLAMIALATWVLGRIDPTTAGRLLGVMSGAVLLGLYPLLLAHWGSGNGDRLR